MFMSIYLGFSNWPGSISLMCILLNSMCTSQDFAVIKLNGLDIWASCLTLHSHKPLLFSHAWSSALHLHPLMLWGWIFWDSSSFLKSLAWMTCCFICMDSLQTWSAFTLFIFAFEFCLLASELQSLLFLSSSTFRSAPRAGVSTEVAGSVFISANNLLLTRGSESLLFLQPPRGGEDSSLADLQTENQNKSQQEGIFSRFSFLLDHRSRGLKQMKTDRPAVRQPKSTLLV